MARLVRKKIARHFKKQFFSANFLSFLILCLIIFLLIESFFMIERRLRPAILSIAELRADVIATEAVNEAILRKISGKIGYQDIISLEQDNEGRIVMAQIDTATINQVMSETTLATQEVLTDLSDEVIDIPMGEVLDNYILATVGPDIPVRLVPLGRVNTAVSDSFEEAGINQVRHKLYIEVITEVRVVIPLTSTRVEVNTSVPITDIIYPGEVPETVVNLNFPHPGNIPLN